ncbi:MAG: hypothetical protein MUE46_14025 [Xanthomonadales bacterium]|nr:hypothetical protein [Xanthomonadales bacterium]
MIRKTLVVAAWVALSGMAYAEKGPDSVTSSPTPDGCTAIPDNGFVTPTNGTTGMICRTITVPAGTINNPEIALGLTHTWIGDITVKVVPPSGAPIVTLFSRPGRTGGTGFGSSADFAQTNPITFRDSSANNPETMGTGLTASQAVCRDGATPLCNFRTNRDEEVLPDVTTLAALNGQAAGGNWQVCVGDGAASDTGSLCTATITASAGPAGPTYTFTPTSHNFPATNIGASASFDYVVANTSPAGGADLVISGCTFGGANAADFAFGEPVTFPVTVPAGFGATGTIRFTPTAAGARAGSVTCNTNAAPPNASFTGTFTGTGVTPPLTSVPPAGAGTPALALGGSNPPTRVITFTNPGATAASLTCTVAAPFTATPSSVNVPANGNAIVTVGLGTASPGNYAAQMSCAPAGGGAPLLFNLTAVVNATPVPTLGSFSVWVMLGLMLGTGLVVVASRKQ